jgi:hypothetical protein
MKFLKNLFYLLITLIFVAIAGAVGRQCAKEYVDNQKENKSISITSEIIDSTDNKISSKPTKKDIQKEIQEFLKKSLPKLPYKIDSGTECYKVDIEYKHVIYFYRLFNTVKEDFDVKWAKHKMQDQITKYYCQSGRVKYFKKEGIAMTYHYVDKKNNFLFKVSANKNDCR